MHAPFKCVTAGRKKEKRMHRLSAGALHQSSSVSSCKPLLNPCALHLFNISNSFGYSPNSTESLYDRLLKSSNDLISLKQLHSALTTTSLILKSPHLGAQIIIKYAGFGDPSSARSLFNGINANAQLSSSFLWNTMVRAHANAGQHFETMDLYSIMRINGISPNNYTYPFVFKACAAEFLIHQGRMAHGDALKSGFDSDSYVEAALVDAYAKCGQFVDARKIFDEMSLKDVVCWTAMVTAYEHAERPKEALSLFQEMQREGILADSVAVVSVASAVGQLSNAKKAMEVHAYAFRKSFIVEVTVANSIIAMHTKCGDMEKARLVFEAMDERNVISWNSMLSGYTQNGQASKALFLFDEMRGSDCEPRPITALIMVGACAYVGSRQLGRKLHDFIIDSKLEMDTNLQNALMDMYAKCGDLETAANMFNSLPSSEMKVSSWNVLISGYGMHGRAKEALQLFSRMREEGAEPNHITYTSILSACSHAGLIDEGRKYFADMTKLSVKPEVKHYACMVDMLGRAGLLQEAYDLTRQMPLTPSDGVWGALLLACKIHGNMELGEVAANNLLQLEPEHTGYYVLMSNIYAASNKWQEVGKMREYMKTKGLKKPAAFSVIEHGRELQGFHTADQENPHRLEVYRKIEDLVGKMKMAGYVPDLSCTLHDVEEEDKEHMLKYHSEKLAVAYGILKIDPETEIRVMNNLRVCNDCHSAIKFISQIYGRKIILRDGNRFHHFEGGSCSCKDYW